MKRNLLRSLQVILMAVVLMLMTVGQPAMAQTTPGLTYGTNYHLFDQWDLGGTNKGGYLDVRGTGCEGNVLCVSTATTPTRDGNSGTWKILSATGKPLGSPVLYNEKVYLQNGFDGSYLDTRGAKCENNALCVSTATTPTRDQNSGTWTVLSVTGKQAGTPVQFNDDIYLQNGFDGSYLDVSYSGCESNYLCVSTAATKTARGHKTTQWRVIYKEPPVAVTPPTPPGELKPGCKISLQADSGQWFSRCAGCQQTVNNLRDTVTTHVNSSNLGAASQFEVVDAGNGKISLKADTGKYVARCQGCIKEGTVRDFLTIHVSDPSIAPAQFTPQLLSNGKYTLKADTGKYVARCQGCSPTAKVDTVAVHVTDPNNAAAQWNIVSDCPEPPVTVNPCDPNQPISGAFSTIRIGDFDGFGFEEGTGLKSAAGGSINVDGSGLLSTKDYLPDFNGDGKISNRDAGDPFDNRSDAEVTGTFLTGDGFEDMGSEGSDYTDLSLGKVFAYKTSSTYGRPFPDGDAKTLPNTPGFKFRFKVAKEKLPQGTPLFLNVIFGDYDVEPVVVILKTANGNTLKKELTASAKGTNDGIIQSAYGTLDFSDVFTDGDSSGEPGYWVGSLDVDFDAPTEPYLSFDFAEIGTKQIPLTPCPGS
ncbi:hypothetical protein [Cyanothece sp. BG0011]|uniref:fascin domain-containing protein n=1 Tax=Cyanothece sp. BG0011 TaxID=2082950 RepID=UPI001300358B|nr:hypothetical protein [Cyanothece sp. BG0011]